MKTMLLSVLFVASCCGSVFAIADDEPSAAREILRGANEARAVTAFALQDYAAAITAIDKEMTSRDRNTRPFALGLYYEAWQHVRGAKGMDADAVRFYNQFRSIQFELRLSDLQLAKLAHHRERKFASWNRP